MFWGDSSVQTELQTQDKQQFVSAIAQTWSSVWQSKPLFRNKIIKIASEDLIFF